MMGGGVFELSFYKDEFLANPSVTYGDTFPCRDGFYKDRVIEISPRASLGRNDGWIIGLLSCPRGLPRPFAREPLCRQSA